MREKLKRFYELLPESQGQNLALTVLYVPQGLLITRSWVQELLQGFMLTLSREEAHNPRIWAYLHTPIYKSIYVYITPYMYI